MAGGWVRNLATGCLQDIIVFKTFFEATTRFLQAPGNSSVYLLCKIRRKLCEGRVTFDRVLWPSCQWTVSNTVLESHRCEELRETYYLAILSAMFLKIFSPCFCFQRNSVWRFFFQNIIPFVFFTCFDGKGTLPYTFEPYCLIKWVTYTTAGLAKAKGKEGFRKGRKPACITRVGAIFL